MGKKLDPRESIFDAKVPGPWFQRDGCVGGIGGYSINRKILPLFQVFEPLKISDENAKIIGPLSISNIVQDSSIYLTVPKNAKHSIKVLIKSAQSGV